MTVTYNEWHKNRRPKVRSEGIGALSMKMILLAILWSLPMLHPGVAAVRPSGGDALRPSVAAIRQPLDDSALGAPSGRSLSVAFGDEEDSDEDEVLEVGSALATSPDALRRSALATLACARQSPLRSPARGIPLRC